MPPPRVNVIANKVDTKTLKPIPQVNVQAEKVDVPKPPRVNVVANKVDPNTMKPAPQVKIDTSVASTRQLGPKLKQPSTAVAHKGEQTLTIGGGKKPTMRQDGPSASKPQASPDKLSWSAANVKPKQQPVAPARKPAMPAPKLPMIATAEKFTAKAEIMSLDDAHKSLPPRQRSAGAVPAPGSRGGKWSTKRGRVAYLPAQKRAAKMKSLGTVADFDKAMQAMPKPSGSPKPPSVYLPGIHNPKSPVRKQKKQRAFTAKGFATKKDDGTPIKKPSLYQRVRGVLGKPRTDIDEHGNTKQKLPKATATYKKGADCASDKMTLKKRVAKKAVAEYSVVTPPPTPPVPKPVKKSTTGEATMSKTNFNDLFKSEIASNDGGEEALIDCPHCEHPITKSEVIAKGKSHKVADDNKGGGTDKGGKTGKVTKPSRTGGGVPKVTSQTGIKTVMAKAEDAEEEIEDAEDQPVVEDETTKSLVARDPRSMPGFTGSMWIDSGEDAALAKSILEGGLGGSDPTTPIDRNAKSSRR